MKPFIIFINVFFRKVSLLIAMLWILSIVVFSISRLAPGDPLQSFYGDAIQSMPQSELDSARERLGLKGSLWLQYTRWIEGVAHGDFGISLKYKKPVLDVVLPLIKNTLFLGGVSYILIFTLSIALAIFCARFEDTWVDRLICRIGTILFYIPSFWLGVVLVLFFCINLQWFPGSGAYGIDKSQDLLNRLHHMILPLFVMIASHLWYYAYMIRNKLLDETRRDYVLLARTKGLGKTRILFSHCLRNVLPTLISIMAISTPHILSGAYVTETVFNYPGIGLLSVSSAKYHDYNLLMIIVLITGFLVTTSSLLGKMISELIDPRMKSLREETW